MKKLANAGYALVLILTAFFPLAAALKEAFPYFQALEYQGLMTFTAVMCLACLGVFLALMKNNKSVLTGGRKANLILIPSLIFLMSMGMKIFFAHAIGCDVFQNSEYGAVLDVATGGSSFLLHISVFPHWSLVCYFDRIFINLFPQAPPYLVCEYVNALLLSLTAVILFFIGLEILDGSILKATMGSVVFAFAPTENLYFLMASNEFLAIFFISVAVLILLKSGFLLQCESVRKAAPPVIITGVSLFIVKFSKSVGIVLIIATFICWLYVFLSESRPSFSKEIRKGAVGLVCLYALQAVLSAGYMGWLSQQTGFPVNRDASPHFLFKGLTHGYFEASANSYEPRIIESGMDYDAINAEFMETVKADLKESIPNGYLKWRLEYNNRVEWGDYGAGVRMVTSRYYENGTGKSFFDMRLTESWLKSLTQAHYLTVLLFALFSVVSGMTGRIRQQNVGYLFVALVIFGASLGMVIGEPQERYKCVIMPYVYLFAGDGIIQLWRLCLRGAAAVKKKAANRSGPAKEASAA